ncbi:uncharacterized protein METZ01_LOCUS40598 [marine metagenome]|uniref:Uncharacterized protein n=1 Tax=marine metagenome TaxID=408172 RepID=A0A381R953_9ZZZZ
MNSFGSNDKSFEERFDPKLRTIGETQFQKHDQNKEKTSTSHFFHIEFSASIPPETKSFLSGKLHDILDFPDRFNLRVHNASHLLRFIDQATYEAEIGSTLSKNVSLPASRIDNVTASRAYNVTIILPKKLDSAEIIVNITRNLFSKLFGNIFFNEQILPLEFYQQSAKGRKQITAEIPEILDLVEELNFHSNSLEGHCESVAKSYRLSMEKEGAKIRKQLLGEWREKWKVQSLSTEEQHILSSIFTEFKESFRTNPEQFNQTVVERIKQLNSQLHFILPHERQAYERFEQERFTHYIRSVLHKLEEISSLSGFVEELHEQLNKSPEVVDLDGLNTQILTRMRQLRKEKKVILFFVPEMPLNSELERIRQRFPLRLIKLLPSGTPLKEWSKELKRMEKHYAESFYSKLYSSLHSLSKWTQAQQELRPDGFLESADGQRLKKLLPVLKFRASAIKGMKSSLGVLLDISEQSIQQAESDTVNQRQLVPLDDFRKAWSYFSASVLTLLYYQEPTESAGLLQGFRADNYLKSILEFVDQQCSRGINHFHIIKLLWLVYEERQDSEALSFILYCIQRPQDILRYTLHQVMRPQTGKTSIERRLEKLPQYRDALITVYKNRLREALD